MPAKHNLIYGVRDGKTISIEEVESGLNCGCVCPACGEVLVAKKGKQMMHHFAHYSGHSCEYGYESSLHLAAKEILAKTKKILLPAVFLSFPNSYKDKELLSEPKEITFDRVALEQPFQDIIPDVVLYTGEKKLFLEIYVTHAVDETKLEKIKRLGVSTLEIDLSKQDSSLTETELTEILLQERKEKHWLFNAVEDRWLKRFYRIADEKAIVQRGFAFQVDDCPIAARTYFGKPYANFTDDCLYCPYCISQQHQKGMLCSGRAGIVSREDFSIPEAERIQARDQKQSRKRMDLFVKGVCPNCGGELVQRTSRYGDFWGCRNYPHCRFTATVDPKTGEIIMKA